MAFDDYHVRIFEQELSERKAINLRETGISGATSKQREAIEEIAQELGYKSLAGFTVFMRSMELDYYDIIKIKYRE